MKDPARDFTRFYYTRVGLGEGCGCAERVIDLHEADRKATIAVVRGVGPRMTLRRRWQRARDLLGLTRRA